MLALLVLLILVSHSARSPYYLDAALALALLSFVGTLAVGRYWGQGRPF